MTRVNEGKFGESDRDEESRALEAMRRAMG